MRFLFNLLTTITTTLVLLTVFIILWSPTIEKQKYVAISPNMPIEDAKRYMKIIGKHNISDIKNNGWIPVLSEENQQVLVGKTIMPNLIYVIVDESTNLVKTIYFVIS